MRSKSHRCWLQCRTCAIGSWWTWPLPIMSDRFKVSSLLARRLSEHRVSLPALLQRAGLPTGFFQQEKIYVTTAELFALWLAIGRDERGCARSKDRDAAKIIPRKDLSMDIKKV